MPKIKDLGINVIPATMRPLEIGLGGFGPIGTTEPCEPGTTGQCVPSGKPQCPKSCPNKTKKPKDALAGGLTPTAIAQLRQQLETQIGD